MMHELFEVRLADNRPTLHLPVGLGAGNLVTVPLHTDRCAGSDPRRGRTAHSVGIIAGQITDAASLGAAVTKL